MPAPCPITSKLTANLQLALRLTVVFVVLVRSQGVGPVLAVRALRHARAVRSLAPRLRFSCLERSAL